MANLWFNFTDGPLETTKEKLVDLAIQVRACTIPAIVLFRNLKKLKEHFHGEERESLHKALEKASGGEKIPPYVFYMAAQKYPELREYIHRALIKAREAWPYLSGTSLVVMDACMAMTREIEPGTRISYLEAAAVMAVMLRGDTVKVFTASNQLLEQQLRPGLGGADLLMISQPNGGEFLPNAIDYINGNYDYDRMIVLTDNVHKFPKSDCKKGYGIVRLHTFEKPMVDFILNTESQWNKEKEAYQNPIKSTATH